MLEAEIDLAERLASREQVLLGQMLERDFVIDSEPLESFDVLSSVLKYVADDVGPPCFLTVVPLCLRVPVSGLRRLQLDVHLETVSSWILRSPKVFSLICGVRFATRANVTPATSLPGLNEFPSSRQKKNTFFLAFSFFLNF